MEYTESELKVYAPGCREMTEKENRVMEDWDKMENIEKYQRELKMFLPRQG